MQTKLALSLMALLLTGIGCTTTKVVTANADGTFTTNVVKQVDIDRVARLSGDCAEQTTIIWLAERPDDRKYFEAAAANLGNLLINENYDPTALTQILDALPVKELKSTEAKVGIAAGRILVREALYEVATVVEGQELIRKTITALRTGILNGLNFVAPPPALPITPNI